jgi:hypothetical protein
VRIGSWAGRIPVVVAATDDVPAILGRTRALDRFEVCFRRGRIVDFR